MRIVIVGSGSQGNTTIFESAGTRILVDAGLSVRALRKRLRELGEPETGFSGIVITHSHSDHIQHANRWATVLEAPLYATAVTQQRGQKFFGEHSVRTLPPRSKGKIGNLTVRTFPLPHDAPQIGVVVEGGGTQAAIVTDLGFIPESLPARLAGCTTVLLESNHCPEMLEYAPYPDFLKDRIRSNRGHLSNEQSASILPHLPDLKRLVLMHLSEKANSPRRARAVAEAALGNRTDVELLVAHQSRSMVLEPLRLTRTTVFAVPESNLAAKPAPPDATPNAAPCSADEPPTAQLGFGF